MNEFRKNYCQYFIKAIEPFLNINPEIKIVYSWIWGEDNFLQDFVNDNTKEDFLWTSGIGLIEACLKIVEESYSNGNILKD